MTQAPLRQHDLVARLSRELDMKTRMLITTTLIVTGALLSTGCLTLRVREEASNVLSCPHLDRVDEDESNHAWSVEGCGRVAYCQTPTTGAEVQCAGGAPGRKVAKRQE